MVDNATQLIEKMGQNNFVAVVENDSAEIWVHDFTPAYIFVYGPYRPSFLSDLDQYHGWTMEHTRMSASETLRVDWEKRVADSVQTLWAAKLNVVVAGRVVAVANHSAVHYL